MDPAEVVDPSVVTVAAGSKYDAHSPKLVTYSEMKDDACGGIVAEQIFEKSVEY